VTAGVYSPGFPRGIESIEKVLNFKIGFQDLEKVLKKYALSIEKVSKFKMKKKFEGSEKNSTEGKALQYLFSVMQGPKLSFMIKNFKK